MIGWNKYWDRYTCPYVKEYKCSHEPKEEYCNNCNYKALGEKRYDDVHFPSAEDCESK